MTFKPYCGLCNSWHTESEPHVHDDLCQDEGCPHAGTDHVCVTRTGLYRAAKSRFNDSWNIERRFLCINGLSAWFTVAVVHEADESELGYTEGAFGTAEERAKLLVEALNR